MTAGSGVATRSNPYNGCEFACTYCDSRSHKYHLHPEFEHIIYVKANVGPMLDSRLSRARTLLPDVVAVGGTCDAYQPAERKSENTRRCLDVLLKHHYPVCISTKSDLILRDVALLKEIAADTSCTVGVTVTTLDEDLARFLEPNAPPPQRRLDILRTIKQLAPEIQTGVHLMPVVPFLADTEASLESVVEGARESGADFLLFGGGMTMRDNQAAWFLGKLGERFPQLVSEYRDIYQSAYSPEAGYAGRYAPVPAYSKRITKPILSMCDRLGISLRAKRFIPNDFRRLNYTIAETLLSESYDAQLRGKPWTSSYWAGVNINNLTESIADIAARGELQTIRNVSPALEARIHSMLGRPSV